MQNRFSWLLCKGHKIKTTDFYEAWGPGLWVGGTLNGHQRACRLPPYFSDKPFLSSPGQSRNRPDLIDSSERSAALSNSNDLSENAELHV